MTKQMKDRSAFQGLELTLKPCNLFSSFVSSARGTPIYTLNLNVNRTRVKKPLSRVKITCCRGSFFPLKAALSVKYIMYKQRTPFFSSTTEKFTV